MIKVLNVIGTRPEAIKMVSVVQKLNQSRTFDSRLCVTGQHREMLNQVLNVFEIVPDYNLDIMHKNQTLSNIGSVILKKLPLILRNFSPDIVLVHGDTSTTLFSALASFHEQIDVGHVEAGLRTNNLMSPWPEEANRQLTSRISSVHFAPTLAAKQNLLNEGVPVDKIIVTGNTVIDTLIEAKNKLDKCEKLRKSVKANLPNLSNASGLILITGHRRENIGSGFENICAAIRELANKFSTINFVYPVHLNPRVQNHVLSLLSGLPNVHLIAPLQYLDFVYLMDRSILIMTDSGGVQEEAPSLGVPVVIMRDTTERPEAVESGLSYLVGTNTDKIISTVTNLIINYDHMKKRNTYNPFGDGHAANRIIKYLSEKYY